MQYNRIKKKSSRKGKLNFMSDIDLLAPLVTLLYYVNQTQTIWSLYCFKKKNRIVGLRWWPLCQIYSRRIQWTSSACFWFTSGLSDNIKITFFFKLRSFTKSTWNPHHFIYLSFTSIELILYDFESCTNWLEFLWTCKRCYKRICYSN